MIVITISIGTLGKNRQRITKGTGRLGNKRTSRDHLDYSTIKIGKNTEKSSGDLMRLAVNQILVLNHQLTLVWKTFLGIIYTKNIRLGMTGWARWSTGNCVGTCWIVDFAVMKDYWVKLKTCEKRDKYPDLARELKKQWNMKLTIIPIVSGTLGTVTKGLVRGLEDLEITGPVRTIQTTALLRLVRILRRVLETWGDLLSFKLQWETIS